MSFERVINLGVSNTADAIDQIVSVMVAAGWTIHDDQLTASDYIIMKTAGGELGDKLDFYVEINHYQYVDYINMRGYVYWNEITHTGGAGFYHTTDNRVLSDDDSSFIIYVGASKDFVFFTTLVSGTYNSMGASYFKRLHPYGYLQSGITAGTDVVITLGEGEADNFKINDELRIAGNEYVSIQSNIIVTAVNPASNQITVDEIDENWNAGACIGFQPFNGCCIGNSTSQLTHIYYSYTGKSSSSYSTGNMENMMNTNYIDTENIYNDRYPLSQLWVLDTLTYEYPGYVYDCYLNWRGPQLASYSYANNVSINEVDTGTVDTSGSNTLTDTSKSWTVDGYVDYAVVITTGPGVGQSRKITSNTSDTLTVDENWLISLGTNTEYIICEELYLGFATTVGYAYRII